MPETQKNTFSELYAGYAAGCLDPAFAMMVETQAAIRRDVHEAMIVSDAIAGSLLEAGDMAHLSAHALDRALAAIDELDAPDTRAREAGRAAARGLNELLDLPEPLRGAAIEAAGQRGWQRMTAGIERLPLAIGSAIETELYRIASGARIPRHSHSGQEYTLVVAGGFSDERGTYGPGDIVQNGPEDTHQPVGDAGHVCYALTVRDGGLRFTGMIGLVQKLLRLD
jgi:putative transcriptional regulator